MTNASASAPLHVVFGAGQIGSRIARLLVDRGDVRVRVVARRPHAPAGVETMAGDARDLAFAATAGEGAAVIYDAMNPPYDKWKQDLLAIGAGSLHAAETSGARLVALDCLYVYGAPAGPMTETTPNNPNSKKGQLRAALSDRRLASTAQVAIARASDFFGPEVPSSWFSDRFFTRLYAGKAVECLGDPDALHAYSYAEDVAKGLVALGRADGDVAGIWHLPTLPAETTRALGERVGAALGKPVRYATMSPLMLRAVGLVVPFMGELPEMAYQWKVPFLLDDTKFRARFGFGPTPMAEQIAATVCWARAKFGAARAA